MQLLQLLTIELRLSSSMVEAVVPAPPDGGSADTT
jgi:hypothetical protein